MKRRDVLNVCVAAFVMLSSCMALGSVSQRATAEPGTLYVDDDGVCGPGGPDDTSGTCYSHPQDAVNAANPYDKIIVYPGIYGSRERPPPWPGSSCSDIWAPALIVYKEGLTIEAFDKSEKATMIESTHICWSNAVAVEYSTNGGVVGVSGWNPSASIIITSHVTIDGFTFERPKLCGNTNDCFWNTAGVFIGSKGAGYGDYLGTHGNIVKNNFFQNVWHGVYIWHSSDNLVMDNWIKKLDKSGSVTGHWAGISVYDGYNDAQIDLGFPSENNVFVGNVLKDKGISLGAWAPVKWTSNAGSMVVCNLLTQVGVAYSHGPVTVACNRNPSNTGPAGFWQYNTDEVIRIQGITYSGDTELWTYDEVSVSISADLAYVGSDDGSGIPVVFEVADEEHTTLTMSGGHASILLDLVPGIYEVETSVTICECCRYHDMDTITIGKLVEIDIRPNEYPNYLNLKARRSTLPVAVLTTDKFDAVAIDPSTVKFEGASPMKWMLTDVDYDGDLDMLFHFLVGDITELAPGDTIGTLTGKTLTGIPLMGTDAILT